MNNTQIFKTNTKNTTGFQLPSDSLHSMYSKEEAVIFNHRIFIDEFGAEGSELHDIFNNLLNAGPYDTLECRISSRGGYVHELQQFRNIIENTFPERTVTILDPLGYSCGALIFCMGTERIVYEHSEIMFHDYSGGIGGKGGEIEAQAKHTPAFIRKLFNAIIGDFMTPEEIEQMIIGKDFWFDTEEMCKRGICTHVMVKGEVYESNMYLHIINPELYPEPEPEPTEEEIIASVLGQIEDKDSKKSKEIDNNKLAQKIKDGKRLYVYEKEYYKENKTKIDKLIKKLG